MRGKFQTTRVLSSPTETKELLLEMSIGESYRTDGEAPAEPLR
jgi:hypothetical protein